MKEKIIYRRSEVGSRKRWEVVEFVGFKTVYIDVRQYYEFYRKKLYSKVVDNKKLGIFCIKSSFT